MFSNSKGIYLWGKKINKKSYFMKLNYEKILSTKRLHGRSGSAPF